MRLVFLDTETTGLNPEIHEMWEYSPIVREDDGSQRSFTRHIPGVSLYNADPMALRIGRFYDRYTPVSIPPRDMASEAARLLSGATLVGANPSFDAAFMAKFLRQNNQAPAWNHRMVDVEVLAMAALKLPEPVGLVKSAELLGIAVDKEAAHTASYDAYLAMEIYDLVIGGFSKPPLKSVAA